MLDNKLEKLKKQKEVLNARIKKIEASQSSKKRKQEKHLKFLIGEHYLQEAVQAGKIEELKQALLNHLKRASDRTLVEEW